MHAELKNSTIINARRFKLSLLTPVNVRLFASSLCEQYFHLIKRKWSKGTYPSIPLLGNQTDATASVNDVSGETLYPMPNH